MLVRDVMQREVASIGPEASLALAARMMRDHDVGCLPVLEGDRLVGMLTDRDIVVRCVAAGSDPACAVVRDAMSTTAFACAAEDSVERARELMAANLIKHLPVTNGQERVVGLVSLRDLDAQFGRSRPYQVTFYKRLASSSGHLSNVEVATVYLSPAIARDDVIPAALEKFARDRGLARWDQAADLYQLEEGG
jgi:CBS domain-containing protein